ITCRLEAAALEFIGPYGSIQSRTAVYLQPLDGLPAIEERMDLEFEASASISEVLSAKVVPWTTLFAPYAVGGNDSSFEARLLFKEAWLEAAWPSWDVRVGNQIFTWARTDGFNP